MGEVWSSKAKKQHGPIGKTEKTPIHTGITCIWPFIQGMHHKISNLQSLIYRNYILWKNHLVITWVNEHLAVIWEWRKKISHQQTLAYLCSTPLLSPPKCSLLSIVLIWCQLFPNFSGSYWSSLPCILWPCSSSPPLRVDVWACLVMLLPGFLSLYPVHLQLLVCPFFYIFFAFSNKNDW